MVNTTCSFSATAVLSSTPYTTIRHEQLKSRLGGLIRSTFICKNGSHTKIQVFSRKVQHCIFVKDESDSPNKYSDIIRMIKFLIDNIYV